MTNLSRAAKEAYFKALNGLRADAAYACRSFPPSVLAGLGLKPLRIPLSVNDGGGTPVREDICPLVDLFSGAMERSAVPLAVGMHTCDMTRRYFQESSRFTEVQVHQIQLPATGSAPAERFFASQVERFCADAVLTGHSAGYDAAAAEEWYRETMEGMRLVESLVPSLPPVALQYFYHFFRIMPPGKAASLIRELVDSHPAYQGYFRLLLSGSPVIPGDDTAAEVIEEACGLLIPVNCTGSQMFPDEPADDWSPGGIALKHFRSQKCIRCRPNRRTFDHLSRMAEFHRAGGVLVKTLTFCDLWYTEKVRLKNTLRLPVLVVDSGLKRGESERTSMRIETFIQSLGAS